MPITPTSAKDNFLTRHHIFMMSNIVFSSLTQCEASSKTTVLPDPLLQKAIDYALQRPPWLSDQQIHPNVRGRPQ